MAVVVELRRSVDTDLGPELMAGSANDSDDSGADTSVPIRSNCSLPVRPSDAAHSPGTYCSGSTPIPMRFERWMRSNVSARTARTPSSAVPLAAQSREDPEP